MKNKKICIIGLGYIGLPTASYLANRGYAVYGVDVNSDVVETINRGEIHIVEPELDAFVKSAVFSGRLKAGTRPKEADIFIIAVPTPFKGEFVPDIGYVLSATESIAPFVKTGDLIILESTSPVGTTQKVMETVYSLRPELTGTLFFSHAPERVLPGRIIQELSENDRIVGGIDDASTRLTKAFYETFVNGKVLATDAKTAEMSKLVENSYRDVNIAFANELSMICDGIKIDVRELIRLANHHPRVNILSPGTGVGGHCIAVDPYFIIHSDPVNSRIIKTAREINRHKTEWVVEKIRQSVAAFREQNGREPSVALLGLAFKPDIDDLRESPALQVAMAVAAVAGVRVMAVEPNIKSHALLPLMELEDALREADIVAVLVAHRQFKNLHTDKSVLDFVGIA
jgi:UDP-N-acetyl-D-mannosaminuronic acid dehydrogenase